jgi:hypothetical protein
MTELFDHVAHEPPVPLPVGVYAEFQACRPSALVVIKKIGTLSSKAEDIPMFLEDLFGTRAESLPQ